MSRCLLKSFSSTAVINRYYWHSVLKMANQNLVGFGLIPKTLPWMPLALSEEKTPQMEQLRAIRRSRVRLWGHHSHPASLKSCKFLCLSITSLCQIGYWRLNNCTLHLDSPLLGICYRSLASQLLSHLSRKSYDNGHYLAVWNQFHRREALYLRNSQDKQDLLDWFRRLKWQTREW